MGIGENSKASYQEHFIVREFSPSSVDMLICTNLYLVSFIFDEGWATVSHTVLGLLLLLKVQSSIRSTPDVTMLFSLGSGPINLVAAAIAA
ncbi:MAG: hypothetical protein ABJL99_07500 [Aliishimia sp.]